MRLRWADSAVQDLESIYSYIATSSKNYAHAFIDELLFSASVLENQPNIGRKVPEYDDVSIRELIHGVYRIIYLQAEKEISVLAVIHGSRLIQNTGLSEIIDKSH